jgi:hypothetical protein
MKRDVGLPPFGCLPRFGINRGKHHPARPLHSTESCALLQVVADYGRPGAVRAAVAQAADNRQSCSILE